MKFSRIVLALSIVVFYGQLVAQSFPFSPDKKVTYVGILFSEAEFVGSSGFTNPADIKERYLKGWNDLMVNEREKFDLFGALKIENGEFRPDIAGATYEKVNVEEKIVEKPREFNESNLQKAVDLLDMDDVEGLAVCWVVESFNKWDAEAHIWLTAFDAKSKKVVWSHEFTEEAGGFGLRNYWAKPFYDGIKRIRKKLYRAWTK